MDLETRGPKEVVRTRQHARAIGFRVHPVSPTFEEHMSTRIATTFNSKVLQTFDGLRAPSFLKASNESRAIELETGHPQFDELDVGQKATCEIASVFLDLTDFTGRSFWDPADEVADLAHAVLSGFTAIVQSLDGHVLGLRGDGLLAGFGPHPDPELSVALAATACAASLDAVRNVLNPELVLRKIRPLQARAGCDFGEATFMRSGTDRVSEVNVIGFTTNFAAKCEKVAASWEMVVGAGFASFVDNDSLLTHHASSPKPYQRDYKRKDYKFYNYRWESMVAEVDSTIAELHNERLTAYKGIS
jgi:adenylate cyclase